MVSYAPDQSGDQQSGYGQPEYAQPQHYGQQSNPQQAYPEQSAPAQPYSEDGQPEGPIDPQQGPQRGYGQEQPLNAQDSGATGVGADCALSRRDGCSSRC